MKIRRFFGKDMREALRNVKEELGADAVILSNKKLADGIELVAAYDKEPALATPSASQLANKASAKATKKQPSLSEIIGDSGPDSLRALLEKQSQKNEQAVAETPVKADQHVTADSTQPRPQAKQASAPNAGDERAMDHIRQELKSLRHVLEYQVSGLLKQEQRRSNPLQAYLTTRLEQMGIDSALAEDVVSYAPADADERDAWLFLLKLLANRITTGGDSILSQTGVVALVGPTGTGKTTTIAKLAARYAQKYGAEQVAMVTIDSYRIAAYEQLATYGKIIGCQVKKAQSDEELEDVLYQLRHKRLVLIDTAGFGQRDGRLIKQLDTLQMHSCANIKKYLVVQANSQYQVIDRTISAYKQISLHGCIFTKLDECYSLGEAISAAIHHRLPVTYLTDGQRVPEDIRVADAKYLITMAAKLYKKYALTHTVSGQTTRSAALV